MVSNFIVQHNLSISLADHLGQLFKNIFTDIQITSFYACAKTKHSALSTKRFNHIITSEL